MVSHIKQLREKNSDKKIVMDKLFNDLVAKDLKELSGCDNMSAILIEFNWFIHNDCNSYISDWWNLVFIWEAGFLGRINWFILV